MDDDILKRVAEITGSPFKVPKSKPSTYDDLFEKHGAAEGVDPALLRAMTSQESSFNPRARSNKNAEGLMQLIPATAARFGVKNVYDPNQNIKGGTKYIKWLLDRYDGDVDKALAGYNAGEGAVDKYKGIPPYKETRDYVKKIRGNYKGGGYLNAMPDADLFASVDRILGTPPPQEVVPDVMSDVDRILGTSVPIPAVQPVPEAPDTIAAQAQSALDPKSPRAAVLTTDQAQNAPFAELSGFQLFPVKEGTLWVSTEKARKLKLRSPKDIELFLQKNPDAMTRLIGKVDNVGQATNQGNAVVTTDAQGRELSSSVVTSPETAQIQAEVDKASFPQAAHQEVMPAEEAALQRQGQMHADSNVNVPMGGVLPILPVQTPPVVPQNRTTQPTENVEVSIGGEEEVEPLAKPDPETSGFETSIPVPKSGDAAAQMKDEFASRVSNTLGTDYQTTRNFISNILSSSKTGEKLDVLRGKSLQEGNYEPQTFTLSPDAIRQLKAIDAETVKRSADYDAKSKEYLDAGKGAFEAQLLAAKDLGIKSFKGVPIDDAIAQEQLAEQEFLAKNVKENPAEAYNRILQTEGQRLSAGESPEALVQEFYAQRRAEAEGLKKEVLAKFGSFTKEKKNRERIEKEYGTIGDSTRPMARPSEFVLNFFREIAKLPATASKAIGIGVDAMSTAGINPQDNPFIQFGDEWEKKLDASKNQDLKDEMIVGDVSKAFAQLAEQALLVPFTGGASMALPLTQGAVGQYDEAVKSDANRAQRIWATTVGGLAAVPDALLKMRFLKGLNPAAKADFFDNVTRNLFTGLAKKVTKNEARQMTLTMMGEIGAKAPVGYITEKYQERLEDVVNKAAAKASYKPDLTWNDVFVPSTREQQGYEAAGIVGAFGGGVNALTSRVSELSTDELKNTDDEIKKAIAVGVLTNEDAQVVKAAAVAEIERREKSITPKPNETKTPITEVAPPVVTTENVSVPEVPKSEAEVISKEADETPISVPPTSPIRERAKKAAGELFPQEVSAQVESAKTPEREAESAKPEAAEKPKPLSNTQIEFSKEQAKPFDDFRRSVIDTADVADKSVLPPYAKDGIFEIEPHITVKYGLHTMSGDDVAPVLKGEKPIEITLGKTSVFTGSEKKIPGTDKPVPYDVVTVEVDSPDLARLNKKLTDETENTTTINEFKPHVTLAYVKSGEGKKYTGKTDFEGQKYTFDGVTFSPADKSAKSVIPLGKPPKVNAEGKLAAVKGLRSVPEALRKVTKTPEFRKFFKGSKVVDEKGEPLVVYHGTGANFDVFDVSKSDLGTHFGSLPQAEYSMNRGRGGVNPNIMPVYLNIKQPLRLKDVGTFHADGIAPQLAKKGWLDPKEAKRIVKEIDDNFRLRDVYDPQMKKLIQEKGFDGIVYSNAHEGGGNSWIVLEPTQIKSAIGNKGTFDPNNPNILRKVPTAEDIDTLNELKKSKDFRSIVPAIQSTVQGDAVELESNEASETVRTLLAIVENRSRDESPVISGLFVEPKVIPKLIDAADEFAIAAESNGVETKGLRDLIANIEQAAKKGDGVLFNDSKHERTHQASYKGADGKAFEARYANSEELKSDPDFQKFHKELNKIQGKTSHGVAMEEALAYLGDGDYARFGLTKDQAKEILKKLIIGYAEANGVESLRNFQPNTELYEAIENYRTESEGRKESDASRGDVDTERETGREPSGQESRPPVDGGVSETFAPTGKEKLSQTPKSLRGKADIPVADRTYTGVTNASQQEFADQQLDKGIEGADKWFRENAADNNLNAGATGVVGLNLLKHYAKTNQIDKLNKTADVLVPMVTEAAQTVQAMATVSMFNPEMAAAYAAKVKKQKTGKDLTQAEADKATSIARDLSETAQVEGVSEVALEQANQFIKELEKDIETAREAVKTLSQTNETISADLTDAQKVIKIQKAKITRLTNDKPRTPKAAMVKDIRKRKDDILASLREKYGSPSLRMVAFNTETLRSVPQSQNITDDLVDWATLTLADNWNKMSLGEFYNAANQLTNGQLTEAEIRELHATAVERLKSDRTMTDSQKASFKTRSEHLRAARKYQNEQIAAMFPKIKTESVNKVVSSIITEGVGNDFSDEAILFALIRKKHVDPKDAMNEFEKLNGSKADRQTMADADKLIKQARIALADSRVQAKNDFALTNDDIANIKEEKRFNRNAKIKAERAAARFYSGLSKTTYEVALDSIVNLRRANLLTGIKTHLKNISSNTMFAASEEATRPLAWLADVAASGLTGERTVQGISPRSIAKSFESLVRQDETLKNIDKDSGVKRALDILRHGNSIDELEKLQHSDSILGEKVGKAGKVFDAYVNGVFKTLGAEDALFKVYAFRRSLEEQANTIAKAGGFRADKAKRMELILNPTNEMIITADQYADFATYQNDNFISDIVKKVKRLSPTLKAGIETIVPYDRTPTNIFLRVLEHTPIGYASAGKSLINLKQAPSKVFQNKYRAAIESDLRSKDDFLALPATKQRELINTGLQKAFTREQQQQFARTFGRASLGSGIFGLGVFMAAAGILTGSMSPEDDDREETKEWMKRREMGIENRSVLIPGVGRFVLTDDPVSKVLTAGATFYEQMLADRGTPVSSAWNGVKESAEDAFFEQPLMNSSHSLVRTIRKAKFGEFTGGLIGTTFIPTLVSDAGEVLDEKARTGSGFRPGEKSSILNPYYQGRGFRNTLLKRVPGARNYLVDEMHGAVPQEVRGGVLRRLVRAIDIFNTRPAQEYKPLTAPADSKEFLKSKEFQKATTDDLVTDIKYDRADGIDTKELEQALKKKVKNAQKAGTFSADEAKRVNDLLGTNYQPREKRGK